MGLFDIPLRKANLKMSRLNADAAADKRAEENRDPSWCTHTDFHVLTEGNADAAVAQPKSLRQRVFL